MGLVIEAQNLTHNYPDGSTAIRDVTLSIEDGEQVAVIGANGSGKSTLQLVLGGLIAPSAGTVRYFEETENAEAVRDRVGVLLQDPNDYLFNTTIREDIEYGPAQLGIPQQAATQRVEELATDLCLHDLLDRPPFRLSGGEKQRAAIASVLAFEPEVLLLDEPFGAVDAHYRERIRKLVTNHKGTVVLFTPSLEHIPELAKRVILIGKDGSTVADGTVRDILTNKSLLAENGLRPPAMVQLFEGILDQGELPLTIEDARQYLLNERE
ncbi:energy-coupling factor ABC transporter ATP-binding protein [Halococcus sp. IIIV-5B]|uniref:energy-coupling factor ABC transporter ATP-binding protein n=1 Tax=Halococcus sp. IIIV-5B TaxID=2321230 RepID=UPI000E71A008|nr:energy-coupling factor ABC transporter ATP-binding protein [Halococcus sp. IIIV-5B]RJT07458.1 ATP-binding cassette domain-containing protein [Halococcus sp. IIIV-5B]